MTEGVGFWSCSNENGKLKSSFPAPNVWVEESDGKENVKASSPSGFPNKFPEEKIYIISCYSCYIIYITYYITVYCTQ